MFSWLTGTTSMHETPQKSPLCIIDGHLTNVSVWESEVFGVMFFWVRLQSWSQRQKSWS